MLSRDALEKIIGNRDDPEARILRIAAERDELRLEFERLKNQLTLTRDTVRFKLMDIPLYDQERVDILDAIFGEEK